MSSYPCLSPSGTHPALSVPLSLSYYCRSLLALLELSRPRLLCQPCKHLRGLGTRAQLEIYFPEGLILFWDKSHASLFCQEMIGVEPLVSIAVKHNLTRRVRGQSLWRASWERRLLTGWDFLRSPWRIFFLKEHLEWLMSDEQDTFPVGPVHLKWLQSDSTGVQGEG